MKNRVRTYLNPEEFKWYSGELAYGDLDSFGNIRITNDKGNQLFLFERQVTFIFIYYWLIDSLKILKKILDIRLFNRSFGIESSNKYAFIWQNWKNDSWNCWSNLFIYL